jgi:predicted transposase/invertase (TIGR01784 family)
MRAERAAAKIDRDYEKFARRMAEEKNRLDIALRREAIRRAGRAEGLAEGLEKGMGEGLEKGRQEGIYEIAKKMKKAGRPLSEIAEFTGLPLDAIEKL